MAIDTLDQELTTEPVPTTLALRPYQKSARDFLIRTHRGFCTFQPGLGKTEVGISTGLTDDLTSLAHVNLVVCPSFLTDMWFDRICKYRPKDRVVLASGTRKARQRALDLKADWYIVNYEMLHARPPRKERTHKDGTPIRSLEQFRFNPLISNVIFDEAHHLKSTSSKHAQAAYDLVYKPEVQVVMLTGTPIKREADDLYMPLHILYPRFYQHMDPTTGQPTPRIPYSHTFPSMYFDSYYEFVKNYCFTLPSSYHTDVFNARRTPLQNLMDNVAYFTSYADAGIYRPEVEPLVVRVTLDAKHKEAYDEIASSSCYGDITLNSAMAVMHCLRTVTCCPAKIKATVNIAEQFDSALIYVEYLHSAKLLKEELEARLVKEAAKPMAGGFIRSNRVESKPKTVAVITGEVSKADRWRILADKPNYIISTLATGSEGIDNLTYMNAVLFFEETYTPLEIEQGIDRVRRAGNETNKVNVYFIHAKNTIDEIIHAVQDRRGVTAEYIIRKVLEKYKKLMRADPEKYIQSANTPTTVAN